MVIAVIPYPCDRVAGQRHGRAGCEHKFEPFRHFKPPMGQIAMQIKRCANSAPKKEHKHNRQIGDLKAGQESDESEQLQGDQDNKKEEIESFVLKHGAERGGRSSQPGRSEIQTRGLSPDRRPVPNRYFLMEGLALYPRGDLQALAAAILTFKMRRVA